jgi:hypothetical protein
MEIVSILDLLRRHRLLLVPGLGLAVLVGIVALFQVSLSPPGLSSRQTTGGLASAQMLLSATDERASDLRKQSIASTLVSRAAVAGDLVATDGPRADVARRAGIAENELAILSPAAGAPPYSIPISREATAAAATPREPYLVHVTIHPTLPILGVDVNAPDQATAAEVAEAVRAELTDVVEERAGSPAVVVLEELGPVSTRTVVAGPRKAVAVGAALVILVMWCGGVVLVTGLLRVRRDRIASPPAGVIS